MQRKNFSRLMVLVAVLSLAIVACTCGALPDMGQVAAGLSTVESAATQVGTVKAVATQFPVSTQPGGGVTVGKAPEDVPVFTPNQQFFGSKEVVSYFTNADYKTVLDFYKKEMPAKGWTQIKSAANVETDNAAVLYYEKGANKATLTLSFVPDKKQTVVQILIGAK